MLYCQNCMDLTAERDKCPVCGGRLREAKEDDPVYLIEKDHIFTQAIEEILAQNGIPSFKKALVRRGPGPKNRVCRNLPDLCSLRRF